MKQLLIASFVFLALTGSESVLAFEWFEDKCMESIEVCDSKMIDGPCLETQDVCTKFKKGACKAFGPKYPCPTTKKPLKQCQDCSAFNQVCAVEETQCKVRNKVCSGAVTIECKAMSRALKPWAEIGDEVAWELYQAYIDKAVDQGGQDYRIAPAFRTLFAGRYSFNMDQVTLKLGSAGGSALTDCQTIYLPDDSMLRAIDDGTLSHVNGQFDKNEDKDNLILLLHELTHVEQCGDEGSRKEYAVMWFEQFVDTTILDPDAWIRDTAGALDGKSPKYVHDRMPLEEKAINRGNKVWEEIF